MKLNYVIKYVADMNKAVEFYRDTLGLELRFQSPGWTEFVTGDTTLALHEASDSHPAGSASIGFRVADVDAFYKDSGVEFTSPPTETFGHRIARFKDCDGAEVGVSS